jgi:molecular chaperone GrpE
MSDDNQIDDEPQSGAPAGQEQSADVVAVEQHLAETQERLLRTQAELENYRKRSRREYEEAQRYREMDLLRDLLPVLDTVLRAIEASETTSDVESLRAGFRMTAQQIEKLLELHGCGTIATDGTLFDPTVHDAILQQPTTDAAPGTIVGTASRGYKLHDRVVRPAQVIVATQS